MLFLDKFQGRIYTVTLIGIDVTIIIIISHEWLFNDWQSDYEKHSTDNV